MIFCINKRCQKRIKRTDNFCPYCSTRQLKSNVAILMTGGFAVVAITGWIFFSIVIPPPPPPPTITQTITITFTETLTPKIPTETPKSTITRTSTSTRTNTPQPTSTVTLVPIAVLLDNSEIRTGPGGYGSYNFIIMYVKGKKVEALGRSADNRYLAISLPDSISRSPGWIRVDRLVMNFDLESLPVIISPPTVTPQPEVTNVPSGPNPPTPYAPPGSNPPTPYAPP